MSRTRKWRGKRGKVAALAGLGMALAAAVVVVGSFYGNAPAVQTRTGTATQSAATPGVSSRSLAPEPVASAPSARPRPSVGEAFAPDEVIGNLDCAMAVGGLENDTAVVLLPRERGIALRGTAKADGSFARAASPSLTLAEGSRFAVVDREGHVFGDVLPFTPNHKHLGRRADGSVVVGFGDLRLNSKRFRAPETPEPVRIYVDGHVVYSTDKAADFRIAADGSSFFVKELLPAGTSRLVVRDLDSGALEHIEIGNALDPRNDYEGAYGMWYSRDFREVQVSPLHLDRAFGAYRFYRVGGGEGGAVREVALAQTWKADSSSPPRPACKCPKATVPGSPRVKSRTWRTAWRLAT